MQHDLAAKRLMKLSIQGKARHFWVEDGLLFTTGQRVYVPKFGDIRRHIIKEIHYTILAIHPGQHLTRALVESVYNRSRKRDDIKCYVQTCLVCQQDKVEYQMKKFADRKRHSTDYRVGDIIMVSLIRGSSRTGSDSLCSSNAPRSSQHQVGESVMTRPVITPRRRHMAQSFPNGRLT